MDNYVKKFALLSIMFVGLSLSLFAQGREMTIIFKDGSQKSGELLSVRDSLVSFLKKSVEEDEEIASHPEMVDIAMVRDIDKVILHETDVKGGQTGAIIGAGLGAGAYAIGFASVQHELGISPSGYVGLVAAGAVGGALEGLLIGWVAGRIMSEDEETVHPSVTKGLRSIREYARFDEREPRYVRDIIDNLLKEK